MKRDPRQEKEKQIRTNEISLPNLNIQSCTCAIDTKVSRGMHEVMFRAFVSSEIMIQGMHINIFSYSFD